MLKRNALLLLDGVEAFGEKLHSAVFQGVEAYGDDRHLRQKCVAWQQLLNELALTRVWRWYVRGHSGIYQES